MYGGEPKSNSIPRMYKLTHQLLSIVGFNFENESIVGYVNMSFTPLSSDLKMVYINCQQCLIHRVSINDSIEPIYSYSDPTLDVCQGQEHLRHNIETFESCHRNVVSEVNPDNGKGEICILIPEELHSSILDLKPFQVIIEFSLVQPKGGLKFVVPDVDGTLLERAAHLFSYGHENSSRLWFPCIDSYSEVCTWKLEFTVSMYMTAVSCGELTETIYSSDLRQKIYHYYLAVPTAAPNIALAVGPFEVWVDPNMHEVTNFCLPGLSSILKHTTSFIHTVFEFYEELLSTRYPYSCYKQVFVDMAYEDITPYATMTICSINLLHSKKVIEQTIITQKLLSKAIAQQFFGCYISRNSWNDAWLTKGLASLLSSLFQVKTFGHTNYVYDTAMDMRKVCEYELNTKPVLLDPSKNSPRTPENPRVLSSAYLDIYELKSSLVMRLLEKLIGREFMLQVMHKLLVLASNAMQQEFSHVNSWSNMVISTASFIKCIMLATGKDVSTYINQWVYQGGAVVLVGSFNFNKKRNVLELELKQDLSSKNSLPYAGPITIAIQELDGTFSRQYMIEESRTKFDIACHSKSRRQKKKKIPLWTGEEVEINLDDTDAESPVLWVRIDPDMNLLRIVKLEQADFMWRYMLVHERCVVAQLDAVQALEKFPSDDTKKALIQAVEHEKFFPKIREAAAFCLMKIENHLNSSSALTEIFKKFFGSPSCPLIVRRNNFSNFQHYFLQKSLPLAISKLRNANDICSPDTLRFLLNLFKYNDNSINKYSDCYYKATLVDALANTVTQAMTTVSVTWNKPSADLLTSDAKEILEEIVKCLNVEKIISSYKFTVTVSCLRALRRLQSFGHLPCDPSLFKSYAVEGNFVDVRLAALDALIDYAAASASSEILDWVLNLVVNDVDPFLRFKVVQMLIENPPFKSLDSPLNTESLKERLWDLMNSGLSHDCRLRCAIVDLYKVLYTKPSKLFKEISKDKKSSVFALDVGCSRDGSEFSRKRKADSPPLGERKSSFMKLDSWADASPEHPSMVKAYHSENSSDGAQILEEKKDSPSSLSKVNSLWSSIYPSSSRLFQDIGTDLYSTGKSGKDKKESSKMETEGAVRGEVGGEMNLDLSELSCSSSSRESTPKRRKATADYRSMDMSYYGGSQNLKQVSSLLSEEEDEDDFGHFGPSNLKSASEGNSVNKVENDYDDEDEDNVVMNLSSDSEMDRSRLSSPDVDDDDA